MLTAHGLYVLLFAGFWSPLGGADGASILGIFHVPLESHFVCGSRLLKELATRGHSVTMVSPFSIDEKVPNFEHIQLEGIQELKDVSKMGCLFDAYKLGSTIAEQTLNDSKVQNLLKASKSFDLVIMDPFSNEAHLGFAFKYDAPVIILSSTASNFWTNQYTKVPTPTSYISEKNPSTKMTYMERMTNFIKSNALDFYFRWLHLPVQNQMLHRYFPDSPDIKKMFNEVSMVFLNTHYSFITPRPTVPTITEVGGFHVEDAKELPKGLKDFLDNAIGGFVLFSMDSKVLNNKVKQGTIMKAFSKLPCKVLWRYENTDNLPEIPQNLRVENSVPLKDILAHRGVRLYVTQGGILNTIEAVYYGVPLLELSAHEESAKELGIGTWVNFEDLLEDQLYAAVLHVTNSKRYLENVRERSRLMRDQPLKPIDQAVFWVEHVLRHEGAPHFQTLATELTWLELYNIDVLALLILIWHLFLFTILKTLKRVLKRRKNVDFEPENKKKKQ